MATAATYFTSQSIRKPYDAVAWCSFLLQHLETLSTLTWYLVADGTLVERVLLRSLDRLAAVSFDPSYPLSLYKSARDTVIAESLVALGKGHNSKRQRQPLHRECIPPDLVKLTAVLEDSLSLSIQNCETVQ